jgi:ubiquinone/menaquinone biosynthesis C-methylase UbiE
LKVKFIQSDAAKIPLADGAVDCVFCNRLLHHILSANERSVFLREFHRVARKYVVISFFDYRAFGGIRKIFKALKGRKTKYDQQPTFAEFTEEVTRSGFNVREVVATGAPWVAQKFFVLEKFPFNGGSRP